MRSPKQIHRTLLRGVFYTLSVSIIVWAFLFLLGIYRYHYHGVTPGHIAWLAATHLPWAETLHKSAYMAGVGAAMVLMLGFIVMAGMFLLTEAVLLILRMNKGKNDG
jgi:hypothetical protein